MENFVHELEGKKVLSKDDILLLKEYVNRKYKNYSNFQKSDILAKAVHQVLDKNITGLSEEYSQIIKQDLLKKTILKDGQTILMLDIFDAYISVQDKSEDFLESLINWTNLHVENKVSISDIEYYDLTHHKFDNTHRSTFDTSFINNFDNNIANKDPGKIVSQVEETVLIKPIPKMPVPAPSNLYRIKYINKTFDFTSIIKLKNNINMMIIQDTCCLIMFCILFFCNKYAVNYSITAEKVNDTPTISSISDSKSASTKYTINESFINSSKSLTSNLPDYFKYKSINQTLLKNFLLKQNSLLVEEPYFSTIISVSKNYNLNPLVLFAITGQEQGFVPKGETSSKKIANNPFNVYHSWKEYNTDINDSSKIVSLTIINLCKDRPENEEPFHWINKKYAEDKNWSTSVLRIYNKLEANNLL